MFSRLRSGCSWKLMVKLSLVQTSFAAQHLQSGRSRSSSLLKMSDHHLGCADMKNSKCPLLPPIRAAYQLIYQILDWCLSFSILCKQQPCVHLSKFTLFPHVCICSGNLVHGWGDARTFDDYLFWLFICLQRKYKQRIPHKNRDVRCWDTCRQRTAWPVTYIMSSAMALDCASSSPRVCAWQHLRGEAAWIPCEHCLLHC